MPSSAAIAAFWLAVDLARLEVQAASSFVTETTWPSCGACETIWVTAMERHASATKAINPPRRPSFPPALRGGRSLLFMKRA